MSSGNPTKIERKTRQIILKKRPIGPVTLDNFEMRHCYLPALKKGQLLIRAIYMSLDPYMRGRMDDTKSYAQNFQVGQPLKARVIGEVVDSKNPEFICGDVVLGVFDWADFSIVSGSDLQHINPMDTPLKYYLGPLGMPGMTAWIGMELAAPRLGETVFISAASGGVGQIAGQIAKLKNCRTIGSAGTDEKVKFLLGELGFDKAFNYKTVSSVLGALQCAAPNGIDIYFDNVGGEILEAALDHANEYARFIQCGMISQYNLKREEILGIRNLTHINRKRIRMEGFIVSDHANRSLEFMDKMKNWLKNNEMKYRIDTTQGLENAASAFISMMNGANFGKKIIQIGADNY